MKNNLFSTLVVNKNFFKKSLFSLLCCFIAMPLFAEDVTFEITSYFDGSSVDPVEVTEPVDAVISTNASKSNAKDGKLGSDGHYFQIVLKSQTFSAASINGYINTTNTEKNWGFQFSVDGGENWGDELLQANDGEKSHHDIPVEVEIPAGANGFRVVRKAGTSTLVQSITLTLGGDPVPSDPTPVVTDMTFTDQEGKAVIDANAGTITAQIKNGGNLEAITPQFKGKNIKGWTPEGAQDFSIGPVDYSIFGEGPQVNFSVTITEAPKEEPGEAKYISSLFFEQIVLDEGVNYDIEGALMAHNYNFENINSLDSLNDEKDSRNEPYLGLKIKKTGGYISGTLKGGSTVRVKFGYVAEVVNVSVNNSSQALEPTNNRLDNLEFTAQEDVHIKISTTSDRTVVLKQIAVDEGIRDVTLPESPSSDPVPVTGVSLDQPSISIEEGKTATLKASIEPFDATDESVSWSSSDEGVAQVDNNGKVTAVAEGTATITVTTNDGGFTASCEVTVTKKPDTPEPPTPSGDAIFEWVIAGENNINEDATDLSSNYGNLIVGTSIQARLFKENPIEYNAKGYKLGNNDVCFEIQGTSDFQIGDVVTIAGVCGGDGERSFAIAPVSTEDAKADTALTNAIDDKTNTNNFIATITEKQVGQKIRIFRLAGKTMYLSAIKVTRGGETPPPSGDVPVTGVTLDKSEQEVKLEVGGSITLNATVEPSNAANKKVIWSTDEPKIATVDQNGKVTAVAEGTAKAIVTTEDGEFSDFCYITVTKEETPDIPETDLTLHVPGVYEAKASEGGYDAELTPFNNREYEVYYINRDGSSNLSIAISNADKSGSICDNTKATEKSTVAQDGWVKISDCNGTGGDTNAGAKDEFGGSIRSVKFNSESHELVMHIKGYDQFSFYGKDNNKDASKNRMFVLYIDGVKQERTPQEYAINRFDISTGEHVIRLTAVGGSDSKLCSFSLRVAQEPRIKYFKGNDSTQVVLQTTDIKPIRYTTKYNDIDGAEIKLEFDRTASATGIELTTLEGGITDTIVLSGKAMCPVGEYHYSVVSYLYGKETSRANGAFSVISQIVSVSEINVTADQGEEMDPINFYYYALSPDDVQVNWPNGEPGGTVKGHGTDGTGYNYVIDGKPENVGQFPFEISVLGADTVITGLITVESSEFGPNPVLYLFKNTYENDGVFEHLKKNWSPKPKKALDQLREPEEYAKYKLVVISEDADADNKEVLALARGGAAIPILNLNGFSYAEGRLEWGDPSNGSVDTVTNNGCKVYIERDDHPIFRSFKGKSSIQVFSELVAKKGVMPIDVTLQGTQCLATAYTRNIMDYYKDGEKQTVIHEIPARMRGEQKYICFPISRATSTKLTPDGENLLDAILAYLMDPTASPVFNPDLQIHSFSLQGHDGIIDQTENTITIEITDREFMALDSLRAVKPSITLAESKYVHVTPSRDKEQDFRFSFYMPIVYTVSDYINRLSYSVSVRVKSTQGIEDVYAPGDWVNVFDIYGRKVATTNEDIYSMSLPHGMYIVVTESGETLKIMR